MTGGNPNQSILASQACMFYPADFAPLKLVVFNIPKSKTAHPSTFKVKYKHI